MAEVTINIESSLAAMAFVVADQQEDIKVLRERVGELMNDYNKLAEQYNECDRIRDEWAKNFERCSGEKEELYIKLGNAENKYDELKQELDDVKSDLAIEKASRRDDVDNLKKKMLKWQPYTQEDIGLTIENHSRNPFVCVKLKVIKEGMTDNGGRSIPIGTTYITWAYLTVDDGKYILLNSDSYTDVLAWCVVSEDNFVE